MTSRPRCGSRTEAAYHAHGAATAHTARSVLVSARTRVEGYPSASAERRGATRGRKLRSNADAASLPFAIILAGSGSGYARIPGSRRCVRGLRTSIVACVFTRGGSRVAAAVAPARLPVCRADKPPP